MMESDDLFAHPISAMDAHLPQAERYREDVEEDHPATKRRRVGIAETLISTVVSVAIISTAVGYTAYKL